MQFKSKMLTVASVLVMATSITAQAQNGQQQPLPPLEKNAPIIKHVDVNHVMAVVDGKDITAGQLDTMAGLISPELARLPEDQRRLTTLRVYLDMAALSKEATQSGLENSPQYQERMAIARNGVLQQLFIKKSITDKISEAELKDIYDREISAMPKTDEVQARHILVSTKAEAEDVLRRLKKGERFADIAKKVSKDGSSTVGGDLGYFSAGQMVEPFEKAAFALKVGEYTTTPVETPFGWHIIKAEDRRPKQPPEFDDVKDSIRAMLTRNRYQAIIGHLRDRLPTKYTDDDVAKAMENLSAIAAGAGADEDQ